LCEEDIRMEHKYHKIEVISNLRQILIEGEDKIKEINGELDNLIEFNNVVLRNEEYFINSIKNIGKSLEEGNKRDSKDIKCLFTGLSRGIENSFKANDKLKDEYQIQLLRKDKYLHLNYRHLGDKGFKYISQIAFNQLKEIDISENKITNIEPFKKMSLPFLEYLNLSCNRIQIIEPVAKLKSNNLEYIFLQRNEIMDIEAFLESYFPALKILRVEDNNIGVEIEKDEEEKKKTKEILNKINKKYSEKFVYKSIEEQIKEFTKKYKLGIYKFNLDEEFELKSSKNKDKIQLELWNYIKNNIVNIDLSNIEGGDEMLKYLFLIITYKPKNKIKYLNLRNNDIKDPSMLNRINFIYLAQLDLGENKIEDLKFLQNMKSENLKELYLDNNLFNDICPILNAHFPSLKFLSLNENKLDYYNLEMSPEFHNLINKFNRKKERLIIQLYSKEYSEKLYKKRIKEYLIKKEKGKLELKESLNNISQNQSFPKNEFLCPECGEFNPEISKINVDNKKIEFHCKKCGEKEYKSKYFYKELHDDIFYYYLKPKELNGESHYWFKEYRYRNNIKRSEIKKSLCKKLENAKEIIKKKNEKLKEIIKFNNIIKLKEIIKFNNIIKDTSEKYQNNYFHLKSLKNIYISLRKEIVRDSNDLKFLFAVFNNEIEFSDKAIDVLLKEKDLKIERQEENLILNKKNLYDINIIYLSQIKFNQLKEIDLSDNEITNIELLCNMNLPFLEFLNLSYNRIRNIEPLSEINSRS